MFSIQDLINKSIRGEKEERKKEHWNATDLGKCLSGAYYKRLGLKPDKEFDDRTLRVFKAGNLFEDFVIKAIEKSEEKYDEQVRVEWPEYDFTGYADLVINDLVYEIKSVHSRKFWWMDKEGKGADRHYLLQVYSYMTVLKKNEGRLIYVSKDDLVVREFVVLKDKDLESQMMSELEILNKAWKDKKPPEPVPTFIDGKLNWQAEWCDYHSYCLNDMDWLLKAKRLKNKRSQD